MDRRFFLSLVAGSVVGPGVLTPCRGDDDRPPKPSRILRLEGEVFPSPDGTVAAVSSFDVRPHVVDVESGKVKARLALPATFRAGAEVFFADGSKIAGTARSEHGRGDDFVFVWEASSGKLLRRVAVPDSAVYVHSLRFAGKDVLYAGARNEIYRYDLRTGQLAALECPVQYYAIDLAVRPDREVIAYTDGQGGAEWGLRRWSLAANKSLPAWFQPGKYKAPGPGKLMQSLSVDYSTEGSEVAVSVAWPDMDRGAPSKIYRFETATGEEVGSGVVPHHIQRVRYVGDSKVLLVWRKRTASRFPLPMKRAALASVAVLAVVALGTSNLLSQAPELEPGTAALRAEYVKLSEMKSKKMSNSEMRKAIQEMQWLQAEADLKYAVSGLKEIVQKYTGVVPARPEIERVLLKANLAIQLMETQDTGVLTEVQETLKTRSR